MLFWPSKYPLPRENGQKWPAYIFVTWMISFSTHDVIIFWALWVPRRIICWLILLRYNLTTLQSLYKKVKVKAAKKESTKRMIGKSSGAQSAACCRIKQVRVFERQGSCKYKYKTANTKLKIRSWEYKRKINQKFSSPACRHKIVPESAWKIVCVAFAHLIPKAKNSLLHLACMCNTHCVSERTHIFHICMMNFWSKKHVALLWI